jgi:hypothetical protein
MLIMKCLNFTVSVMQYILNLGDEIIRQEQVVCVNNYRNFPISVIFHVKSSVH